MIGVIVKYNPAFERALKRFLKELQENREK